MAKDSSMARGKSRRGLRNSSDSPAATSQPVKAKKIIMKGAMTSAASSSAGAAIRPSSADHSMPDSPAATNPASATRISEAAKVETRPARSGDSMFTAAAAMMMPAA